MKSDVAVTSLTSVAGIRLLLRRFASHPERYVGSPKWISRASKSGEGLLYGIAPGRVRSVLAEQGLGLASDCRADELTERYLRRADGTIMEKPYQFSGHSTAIGAARSDR